MKKAIFLLIAIILFLGVINTKDPPADREDIEQLEQKIDQTIKNINDATIEQQQQAIDILRDASYHHRNEHVQGVARTIQEAIQVKYQTQGTSGTRLIDVPRLAIFPGPQDINITFVNDDPQKPVSGNISDIYIQPTEELVSIGGELGFDGMHDMILHQFATDQTLITLSAKVRDDVQAIEVIRDGNKKSELIKDFREGQTEFSYEISSKEKNLRAGSNSYLIRAYAKNTIYHTLVMIAFLDENMQSRMGEKILSKERVTDKRWEKMSQCYQGEESDEEQIRECIVQIRNDNTIKPEDACQRPDGFLPYFLQVQRPEKVAEINHLYKNSTTLYYPIQIGDQYPNCEDEGYELRLYQYDCETQERSEIIPNQAQEDRLSKCDVQIKFANDRHMVTRKIPYERHGATFEGYELVNLDQQSTTPIQLFDTIQFVGTGTETITTAGFDGNEYVIQQVNEIVGSYRLGDFVYDGIDFEIIDLTEDLQGIVRIYIFGRDTTRLVYDIHVDILATKFLIDQKLAKAQDSNILDSLINGS